MGWQMRRLHNLIATAALSRSFLVVHSPLDPTLSQRMEMQWEGEGWRSDLFDAALSVSASVLV